MTDLTFRRHETLRFLVAITTSSHGRGFFYSHMLSALVLSLLVCLGVSLALFGMLQGYMMRWYMLLVCLGFLFALLSFLPLATMPFFSFKDVLDRCVRTMIRRRLFINLSSHVFFRPTFAGHISLHLAKAHRVLGEKHLLLMTGTLQGQNASRQLAHSLRRSIRVAVRQARNLARKGIIKPHQQVVGATYAYLFGAAESKLRLRRRHPPKLARLFGGVFYRYGALHAVYMYFIIHDRLPLAFDPVYFVASVDDLIAAKNQHLAQ